MKTVEQIIKAIYGTEAEAMAALNVKRVTMWNWKSWGHFPALRLHKLLKDAKAAGADIDVADIPLTKAAA